MQKGNFVSAYARYWIGTCVIKNIIATIMIYEPLLTSVVRARKIA
jgi:hypothetical protein